jgi:hypothetical protein
LSVNGKGEGSNPKMEKWANTVEKKRGMNIKKKDLQIFYPCHFFLFMVINISKRQSVLGKVIKSNN